MILDDSLFRLAFTRTCDKKETNVNLIELNLYAPQDHKTDSTHERMAMIVNENPWSHTNFRLDCTRYISFKSQHPLRLLSYLFRFIVTYEEKFLPSTLSIYCYVNVILTLFIKIEISMSH